MGRGVSKNPDHSLEGEVPDRYPSGAEGRAHVERGPSATVDAEELLAPVEEVGFSLLDFTPALLRVSMFRWTPDQGEAALDALSPFRVLELPRAGGRG